MDDHMSDFNFITIHHCNVTNFFMPLIFYPIFKLKHCECSIYLYDIYNRV